MTKRNVKKLSASEKRKLEDAKKSFQETWKEVKPFVKKRNFVKHSTTGKWRA